MIWKKTNEQKRRTGCRCSIQQPDMQCPMGKYYSVILPEMYAVLIAPGFLRFSPPTRAAMHQEYNMQREQYHRHARQARTRTQTLLQTTL